MESFHPYTFMAENQFVTFGYFTPISWVITPTIFWTGKGPSCRGMLLLDPKNSMLHHLGIFNYTSPRPDFLGGGIFGRDFFFPNPVFWGDQPRPTLVAEKFAEISWTHQLSKWKFQSTRWILTQTLDNKSYSKNPMKTKYHFLCGQNVWWRIVWLLVN